MSVQPMTEQEKTLRLIKHKLAELNRLVNAYESMVIPEKPKKTGKAVYAFAGLKLRDIS